MEMCIIEISKKSIVKNCRLIFSGIMEKCSRQNLMPENEIRYLNMKISDILVEIIDLQLLVHPNKITCRKRGRLGMDSVSRVS